MVPIQRWELFQSRLNWPLHRLTELECTQHLQYAHYVSTDGNSTDIVANRRYIVIG